MPRHAVLSTGRPSSLPKLYARQDPAPATALWFEPIILHAPFRVPVREMTNITGQKGYALTADRLTTTHGPRSPRREQYLL